MKLYDQIFFQIKWWIKFEKDVQNITIYDGITYVILIAKV